MGSVSEMFRSHEALARLLPLVPSVAVVVYDDRGVEACVEIYKTLAEADNARAVRKVVLLGCAAGKADVIREACADVEVMVPHKQWTRWKPKQREIACALVVYVVSISPDLQHVEELQRMMRHTRCAYAVFLCAREYSLFGVDYHMDAWLDLRLLWTPMTPQPAEPTVVCREKQKAVCLRETLTAEDVFFQCMAEVKHGCEACNQSTNYGARRRCPMAQHQVAAFYKAGDMVPQSDRLAHLWEMKAARQGYRPAMIQAAEDLRQGRGCERNIGLAIDALAQCGDDAAARRIVEIVEEAKDVEPVVAVPYVVRLSRAASVLEQWRLGGDVDMTRRLADAFAHGGLGLPADEVQQKDWEEKCAAQEEAQRFKRLLQSYDQGDKAVCWKLAQCYLRGEGTATDEKRACELAEEAAEQGDADAMVFLCETYYKGNEALSKDYALSAKWGEAAMAAGRPDVRFKTAYASSKIGKTERAKELYMQLITDESDSTAMNNYACALDDMKMRAEWFRKAAEAGNNYGCWNLGILYRDGRGVERDYGQAAVWFTKAAEKGQHYAMRDMAWMCRDGLGMEKNMEQAVAWYEKAMAAGDEESMIDRGDLYVDGNSVEQNTGMAMECYRMAAERGNATAYYKLGVLYEQRRGDEQEGIYWYRKAAEKGVWAAKERLKSLGANWIEGGKVVGR